MSGPRYQPSRRSRFRAHDSGIVRPPDAAPADPAALVEESAPPTEYEPDIAAPAHDETITASGTAPAAWPTEAHAPEAPAAPTVLPAETVVPDEPEDELPRAFQLRKVYEESAPARRGLMAFYLILGSLILLSVGLTTGYLYGSHTGVTRTVVVSGVAALPGKSVEPTAISAAVQTSLDAAFDATKQHRYADAEKMFAALHDAHPEWPSMAIESARATLYEMDAQATGSILSALTRYGPLPDAEFMKALLHLTHKEFDAADHSFGAAVALDPARADFYYFWGESLRDQGKPREAAEKFRAALLRNQYETSEDLYQLKLWLSEIQADQEESGDANAKINEALSATRPSYSAVFAAAAREIKAGKFKEAAAYFAQAQQLTEPVVYRVILQDPTFVQESWQPELSKFYR